MNSIEQNLLHSNTIYSWLQSKFLHLLFHGLLTFIFANGFPLLTRSHLKLKYYIFFMSFNQPLTDWIVIWLFFTITIDNKISPSISENLYSRLLWTYIHAIGLSYKMIKLLKHSIQSRLYIFFYDVTSDSK